MPLLGVGGGIRPKVKRYRLSAVRGWEAVEAVVEEVGVL